MLYLPLHSSEGVYFMRIGGGGSSNTYICSYNYNSDNLIIIIYAVQNFNRTKQSLILTSEPWIP